MSPDDWKLIALQINSFLTQFIDTITQNASLFVDIVAKENYQFSFQFDLSFDNAQRNAIIFLSALFFLNSISIIFIWKTHGQKVFKRFKKPTPPRVFEELNRSVSNLKLPKVHSPRM